MHLIFAQSPWTYRVRGWRFTLKSHSHSSMITRRRMCKKSKNAASHDQARDRVFVSLPCSVFALFCIFDVSEILLCATVRLNSKLSGPWNSEDSRTLHKWDILEQFLLFQGWRSCSRIYFGVHVQLRPFPCEKVNGTLGRSLFSAMKPMVRRPTC